MKKSILTLLTILICNCIFSQSYKSELEKLNKYLKTFDNGYYGYLEIKDGYLYDRFPSGKYTKSSINELTNASVAETNRKVIVKCKSDASCVFSTYTDSYHSYMSFSQATDFNTTGLITLLDNLIEAYKNPNKSSSITQSASSNPKSGYQTELQKLNDYLKTFDNGYYGYFEVKDDYIYDRFKAGKYNKFKMEDMEGAVIQEQYSRVIFKCKAENKCISTDWKENGKEGYTQFTQNSSYNYKELAGLLNDFRDAYLGKKPTSSNNTTEFNNKSREQSAKERQQKNVKTNKDAYGEDEDWDALESAAVTLNKSVKEAIATSSTNKNYQVPLQKLNDYLKTFNAETYKEVEVKDGKVYFGFYVYGAKYNSSIDINELKNNTIITIGKSVGSSVVDEVKISCKGGSKCFYSIYSNGDVDHFRFFSHSVKDFTKMKQLVDDFINAL